MDHCNTKTTFKDITQISDNRNWQSQKTHCDEPLSLSNELSEQHNKFGQLDPIWRNLDDKYELLGFIGKGTYGEVVKARQKCNNRLVAIKLMRNIMNDRFQALKVVSEVHILRELSELENNVFTTKVFDFILPESLDVKSDEPIPYLFIVMEHMDYDLKQIILKARTAEAFNESHITVLLYNMLCSLNFIHSAGLMHRDIKTNNILVDGDCIVKICDFGMARPTLASDLAPDGQQLASSQPPTSKDERLSMAQRLERERPQRRTRKRALSHYVIARRYRPPEIIMFEKQYDTAVDIWSLGCVLAELLRWHKIDDTQKLKKAQVFPGKYCFPLTPGKETDGKQKISSKDQMREILKVLGPLSDEDKSFITENQFLYYLSSMENSMPNKPGKFDHMFKHVSADMRQLLKGMLEFNPHFRLTARQALDSKVFDSIRCRPFEQPCPIKISHDKLYQRQSQFDYETGQLSSDCSMTVQDLKKMLVEEVNLHKRA